MVAALLKELSGAHGNADDQGGDEAALHIQYAIVNSRECVTGRHLFETTLRRVAAAVGLESVAPRCENLAQLTHELSKILKHPPQSDRPHFVLVFDSIDRQREAPATLLPALARLSEIVGPSRTILEIQRRSVYCPRDAILTRSLDPFHDSRLHPHKPTSQRPTQHTRDARTFPKLQQS